MKQTRLHRQGSISRTVSAARKPDYDLRVIFEDAPIGIYQCTIYQFIAGNPMLARMFGYQSAPEMAASVEIPGELFLDFDQERSVVSAAMASKKAIERRVEFLRRDGSTFTGELCMKAVRSDNGDFKFIHAFIEDVTARKRAELERLKMLLAFEQENLGEIQLAANWDSSVNLELSDYTDCS